MKPRFRGCFSRGVQLAFLAATASTAIAGEAVGTVEFLQSGHGQTPDNVYFLVQITGQRTGAPSCANDPRMAINPNTPAGKTIVARLPAAKASGSTVRIFGNGACDVMGTHESISYMRLY